MDFLFSADSACRRLFSGTAFTGIIQHYAETGYYMYVRERPRRFAYSMGYPIKAINVRHRMKTKWQVLLIVIAVIAFLCMSVLAIDSKLSPVIAELGQAKAQAIGTRAIYSAINEVLSNDNITYNDLVTFEKGADGNIQALKTNIVKINEIKSQVSVKCLDKLTAIDQTEVSIPIGNLINGELFSGRGPRVKVKLIPVGTVIADVKNAFESAGINQTRHQILMDVIVNVGVVLPRGGITVKVNTQVCIAETVLVGSVPQTYTNINGDNRSTLDKVNDYTNN